MAKRKTRQQKIIADLKRQLSESRPQPLKAEKAPEKVEVTKAKYQFNEKKEEKTSYDNSNHLMYTNPYLGKDLRKTAILTTGIVIAQILLFFLLKQQILILPGISY
jgi:hypothetical protein